MDGGYYDYCFLGVEPGSAVAVSNHGCWRSPELRRAFLDGLPVLIERLQPSIVFVHDPLFGRLGSRSGVVHLAPDRTRAANRAA